ncbi:MAG: sulfatase [Planctomycetota bacterium]
MLKRPNILFVLSDQHSPRFLDFEKQRPINTPSMGRLAREGVFFDNAYCQNPICVPSRASLITGRYSRNVGIYDNQDVMQAHCTTFPRVLSAAGYRTCLIGKSHFNGEQFHGYQQRPYGDFYGQAHQPDPTRTPANGASGLMGWFEYAGSTQIPLPLTQTEICVAETVKWLQGHVGLHAQQPFCLSVHFDKPHFPINPPLEYYRKYEGRMRPDAVSAGHLERAVPFVRKTIAGFESELCLPLTQELHAKALAAYSGCVEWVDNALGRVLEVLDYLELSQNTIVIYTSDHGEMASEHGTWQKTLFFEASARVPLLIRWPGQALAGKRDSQLTGLIDLFPTFCAAAGTDLPESCDGINLMPALQGERLARNEIFSESVRLKAPGDAGCMLRRDTWKYCYYLDGAEELYDLASDPGEWKNLAEEACHRELVREMNQRVVEFWKPEEQRERYDKCPRMSREKHFYPYSNQFITGDGTVIDARP